MLRVGSIVLRVDDLAREAAFWSAALDYVTRPETSDDFMLLRPRDGQGPNLSLDRVRAADRVPPRIHLDLYAEDQPPRCSACSTWERPASIGTSDRPTPIT
jgi:hypothetical protein